MKLHRFGLPVVALGVAASLLSFTPETEGYSTLGFQLGIGQRDFRIFNNFTDAGANNNQTPHAQWPGYQGATMSIWKACVEWNSMLHGNGNGDASQSGDIGSGGANFDASFQGETNVVGGINNNIHSELSGSSGGVLAFTEAPDASGWRIRYYSGWNWADGPGSNVGNAIDLQGVACHEYGHALGLGHSGSGNATMAPSISGSGVAQRSIAADDRAGIQQIYGVVAAGKPSITGLSVSGSTVTVTGTNFSALNNRLWFTNDGGDGTAFKISGLSSNGTVITANLPASIGPGDVIVRSDTSGNASLSNSWPFDPGNQSCPAASNYCTAGANSVSASGAEIDMTGSQIVGDNNFGLIAFNLPSNQNGIFFYGPNQLSNPFGNGTLCVGGQLFRLGIITTDIFGGANQILDLTSPPQAAGQITGGSTWNFQFWYRDPAGGGSAFNLTNGLEVPFCN